MSVVMRAPCGKLANALHEVRSSLGELPPAPPHVTAQRADEAVPYCGGFEAAAAVRNLKRIATTGVKYLNIARAHAMGAARYGCTTMGIPPKMLEEVRRMVRSSTSTRAKGGSATADMALQKEKHLDPAYMAVKTPIEKWAAIMYDDREEEIKQIMRKAWKLAVIRDAEDYANCEEDEHETCGDTYEDQRAQSGQL